MPKMPTRVVSVALHVIAYWARDKQRRSLQANPQQDQEATPKNMPIAVHSTPDRAVSQSGQENLESGVPHNSQNSERPFSTAPSVLSASDPCGGVHCDMKLSNSGSMKCSLDWSPPLSGVPASAWCMYATNSNLNTSCIVRIASTASAGI